MPKCSLFDLPAEIREKIWHLVFVLPEPITPMKFSPCASRESSVLRVLTVCRTIYIEAFHLFYRHNDLEFSSPYMLFQFLTVLSPQRRLEITGITVSNFGWHYSSSQLAAEAFSLLLLCPRLQSFRLNVAFELNWLFIENHNPRVGLNIHEGRESAVRAGFNVLHNLRGLTIASIRGVNPNHPAVSTYEYYFQPSDLEELTSPYALVLKAQWTKPALQPVEIRVKKALAALADSRITGLARNF
ncbi:hypothetical protein MMC14_000190 [Varicellaria rhodocarpa]|nr:hypothetical protein [Varicellaria rhodocarpa]